VRYDYGDNRKAALALGVKNRNGPKSPRKDPTPREPPREEPSRDEPPVEEPNEDPQPMKLLKNRFHISHL
jgi:hypothetical protein